MQIKPITTFDINGMPIISQEELSEARAASDPATRKIFNAILSDNLAFICNEIDNNRLDINQFRFLNEIIYRRQISIFRYLHH